VKASCPHRFLKLDLAGRMKVCEETREVKCRDCHARLPVGSTESKGKNSH